MARLAKALVVLRDQYNALAPNRSKVSDGWIGDPAHASRKSEQTRTPAGVLRALDITDDPRNGIDNATLAEALRKSADPRILYIISKWSHREQRQAVRKYTGSNQHDKHFHVSLVEDPKLYDSAEAWSSRCLREGGQTQPAVVERPFLVRGSKGDALAELQRLLKITIDSDFSPKTEKAVKEFQKAKKLTVNGRVVGPQTWGALS